jgi:hypothetical protein
LQAACYVGDNLGKSLSEVFEMSSSELHIWIAWFRLKSEEEKKAHEKARNKARSGRGRR